MEEPPSGELPLLFLLILLNGLLVLAEMALVSSRRTRVKLRAENGNKAWKQLLTAVDDPGPFLSVIQIGITLIGTLTGVFGGVRFSAPLSQFFSTYAILAPWADMLAFIVIVVAISYISIIIGELLPKRIALSNPEPIALVLIPFLSLLTSIFKPLVCFLSASTAILLKLMRIKNKKGLDISEEEIHFALKEAEHNGIVKESERNMVEGVFYLGDRPVETFMTHRANITYLNIDAKKESLLKTLAAHPNIDVFPVIHGEDIDSVMGTITTRAILEALVRRGDIHLKNLCQKPIFIPASMSALTALELFNRHEVPLLIVLDEYGGFSGSLSVQDLLAEISVFLQGDEKPNEHIQLQADGSWIVGGQANIDDVAITLNWNNIQTEKREYHTMAGFVLEQLGHIPAVGEFFWWELRRIEILEMQGNRISNLIIHPPHIGTQETKESKKPEPN